MDELFDLLDRSSPRIKMKNYDEIDNVDEEGNSSDEEGEIKETYNIKDLDFADLENSFESNGFESQIDYIDHLLNTHGDVKPDFSNFDHFMFDNIQCDESTELADIDAKCLVKSESVAPLDGGKERTRNNYLMRPVRNAIVSDTDTDGDNSDSIEEIDLPASGSILDNILASSRNKTKSHVETTKKGRIVDKEAELEYLLPTDLEEKLSRIVISSNTALEEVGTFVQRIEGTQTITVKAARSDPILDLNTIVLGKDKRMIGMIDNIFGIKKEPMYLVVCKNQSIASSFQGGEQLFCAPFVENAYFTAIDTPDSRCDLDNSDFAFSDDEKEETFKRAMNGQEQPSSQGNKKKKVNRKRKPGPNQFEKRSNYQSNNPHHQNNGKFAGQKNPFRTVNTQPFINQSRLPYWPSSNISSPMMTTLNPPPQFINNNNNNNQYSFTNFPPPPMMTMNNNNNNNNNNMMMMMMMNNPNQCTSYAQFQKFNRFHQSNRQ